jgi:hypothetical protein
MSLREIGLAIKAAWLAVLDYPIQWEDALFWLMVPVWILISFWFLRAWYRSGSSVASALTWRHRQNLGVAWRMFLDRRKGN